MATNFQAKWQQLLYTPRHTLRDISGESILVINPNPDPNNPATKSVPGYEIIENLNPNGYNALSHKVIDRTTAHNGASIIHGDVKGKTFKYRSFLERVSLIQDSNPTPQVR